LISKAKAERIATEMAEKDRPKSVMLYSGGNDQVCFERPMENMERYLDEIPGITDIKLKDMEYLFSGMAGIVSSRHLAYGKNYTETLVDVNDKLRAIFNGKQKNMHECLKKLMEGELISKGNFESTQAFMIDLQCQSDLAEGRHEIYVFGQKGTYIDILETKLPFLWERWIREHHECKTEFNSRAFLKFVHEDVSKGEISNNCPTLESTRQSEDRNSIEASIPVRCRSDSGLSENFS
jgi:hypothetical protein